MKHLVPLTVLAMAIASTTGCSLINKKEPVTPSTPTPTTTKLNSTHTIFNAQEKAKQLNFRLKGNPLTQIKLTVNGKDHPHTIDLMTLPSGINTLEIKATAKSTANGKEYDYRKVYNIRANKQANSIVMMVNDDGRDTLIGENYNFGGFIGHGRPEFKITGNATDHLPTTGIINYVGKSFNEKAEGTFSYSIDFAKKEGQGKVLLDGQEIILQKASLSKLNSQDGFTGHGIQHINATGLVSEDDYRLGIFGKNAEEVAGEGYKRYFGSFGFAGTKK